MASLQPSYSVLGLGNYVNFNIIFMFYHQNITILIIDYKHIMSSMLPTVLLKGNVANEQLILLVSCSNLHTTQDYKHTELRFYAFIAA